MEWSLQARATVRILDTIDIFRAADPIASIFRSREIIDRSRLTGLYAASCTSRKYILKLITLVITRNNEGVRESIKKIHDRRECDPNVCARSMPDDLRSKKLALTLMIRDNDSFGDRRDRMC